MDQRQWFEGYRERLDKAARQGPLSGDHFRCPCCGFKTMAERSCSARCPVCDWVDDGQDDRDADVVRGGANGALSLALARRNFEGFGASDRRALASVRPPRPHER